MALPLRRRRGTALSRRVDARGRLREEEPVRVHRPALLLPLRLLLLL